MDIHTLGPQRRAPEPVALIRVINHRDHPVKLSSIGLERHGGGGYAFPNGLPAEVPAHDSRDFPLPIAALKESKINLSAPLRGWALLTTGKTIKSRQVVLDGPEHGKRWYDPRRLFPTSDRIAKPK
jgi:hypothetical protein